MVLKVYNTLSGKKERLIKPKGRPLRLFVCGPTVYDYSHLGHARTYLAFDIIVRYLNFQGFKVFYIQNITNIDDKIINRAKRLKKQPLALANFFEKKFYEDMKNLKITSVDKYARASDFIPQIIKQIQTLIKKGHAYKIEGDGYYFDLKTFPDYGKLSKRTVLKAEDAVSRIDESIAKRNKGDFALWKLTNEKSSWPTPLGQGRPGWHIEDTAISESFFGSQYDLHGGANELKFPHHEAEIAQQESASGKKPFVKIWIHTGVLFINGKKMSKSLKNFISIRDFLKNKDANLLRWIVLNHHYRSPINYNQKLIAESEKSLKSIQEFLEKLKFIQSQYKEVRPPKITQSWGGQTSQDLKKTEKLFHQAMADDLNTPKALATIFSLTNKYQKSIWQLNKTEAQKFQVFITSILEIFGLTFQPIKIPKNISNLVDQREDYRRHQQFIPADRLRKKIKRLGYEVEDTPLGTLIWPKQI